MDYPVCVLSSPCITVSCIEEWGCVYSRDQITERVLSVYCSCVQNRQLLKDSFMVELVEGQRKLRHVFLFTDLLLCAKLKKQIGGYDRKKPLSPLPFPHPFFLFLSLWYPTSHSAMVCVFISVFLSLSLLLLRFLSSLSFICYTTGPFTFLFALPHPVCPFFPFALLPARVASYVLFHPSLRVIRDKCCPLMCCSIWVASGRAP